MSTPKKKERKILAPELAKLQALAKPVDVAYEAVQDAQLAFNTKKAALEAVAIHYQRYAGFLVKRYRLKADEEIDNTTGVIRKSPPKPAAP
jgi:hypothetical protein